MSVAPPALGRCCGIKDRSGQPAPRAINPLYKFKAPPRGRRRAWLTCPREPILPEPFDGPGLDIGETDDVRMPSGGGGSGWYRWGFRDGRCLPQVFLGTEDFRIPGGRDGERKVLDRLSRRVSPWLRTEGPAGEDRSGAWSIERHQGAPPM
jgi:hypothetical protein